MGSGNTYAFRRGFEGISQVERRASIPQGAGDSRTFRHEERQDNNVRQTARTSARQADTAHGDNGQGRRGLHASADTYQGGSKGIVREPTKGILKRGGYKGHRYYKDVDAARNAKLYALLLQGEVQGR